MAGHTNRVMSVSFSPDGRQVVSGGAMMDSTVRLWDAESCQRWEAPMAGHTELCLGVVFSPDVGKWYLGGLW